MAASAHRRCSDPPAHGAPAEGGNHVKALVIICLAGSIVLGALAPAAGAGTPQPPVSGEPTAVERLIRQEDARRNDLRIGITRATPAVTIPAAPRIEIVAPAEFDWLDAAFGALAGVVVVAGVALATLFVRDREPRHV
jgi:hypothetical protein